MFDKITAKIKEKFISTAFVCNMLYILAILHIVLMFILTAGQSVWIDDVHTLRMIEFPFSQLWSVVALDVHPPLYFFYAKVVAGALSAITPLSFITAAKIASVLPYIALIIVGKTKVAKNWGELCGAVFAFIIVAAPQMIHYGIEIRMYSLALLFVTLAFVYAFETAKQSKPKNYVLLAVFSALSAWTHYFACIAVIFIYIALAVWFLRKDRKQLGKLVLSGVGVAVVYLPWLATAFTVFRDVSEGFWIGQITLRTLIDYSLFPFLIRSEKVSSFILGLTFLSVGAYFAFVLKDKSIGKSRNVHFALCGLAVPICTVLVGIVVSCLVTPVFVSRYMLPALGSLWLAFAISLTYKPSGEILSEIRRVMISTVLVTVIVMFGLNNLSTTYSEYKRANYSVTTQAEIFDRIDNKDAIICDYRSIAAITAYVAKAGNIYTFKGDQNTQIDKLFSTIYPQISIIEDFNIIATVHVEYEKTWILLTSQENFDDFTRYCDQQGIEYQFLGSYRYDMYEVYVLEI
jgi:hypothetical protein